MIVEASPKVDYAFKHVYGRDATRPLLIDLIDSVSQPAPEHRIRDVELQNPFNPKESLDDKLSILDIKARDQSGRQFNVEMQMLSIKAYLKRIVYYAAKYHQVQLQEGRDYLTLRPTISISFLDHVLFPETPEHHLRFRLLEETNRFPLSEDLEFHIIELPKFKKSVDELTSDLDFWLYFLQHAEKMDLEALPVVMQRPLILRAFEELTMLTKDDLERERYESRRKAQLDHNTMMKEAEIEGFEKGISQGESQGLEKGQIKGEIRTIHVLEQLLKRPQTPVEQLANRSLDDLTKIAEELQRELSQR